MERATEQGAKAAVCGAGAHFLAPESVVQAFAAGSPCYELRLQLGKAPLAKFMVRAIADGSSSCLIQLCHLLQMELVLLDEFPDSALQLFLCAEPPVRGRPMKLHAQSQYLRASRVSCPFFG